jgi:hypothetical protein
MPESMSRYEQVFFYKDVMLKFLEHAEAMDDRFAALEKIAGEKKP